MKNEKEITNINNDHKRRIHPALFVSIAAFVIIFSALIAGHFWFTRVYMVTPLFERCVYELGDDIDTNINSYISGTEWSVNRAVLDISNVDNMHVGKYMATVKHDTHVYEYAIIIEDTVSPVISIKNEALYVVPGKIITVDDFESEIFDLDDEVVTFFDYQGRNAKEVFFSETGTYSVWYVAMDSTGNRSKEAVYVTVDEAPVISVSANRYLATGTEMDYFAGVTAYDETDGDLTGEVKCNSSAVDLSRPGEYEVIYSAVDSYGLESQLVDTIYVFSPDELQDMIHLGTIDRNEDYIFGAPNLYEVVCSVDSDIETVKDLMLPCTVNLTHRVTNGWYKGSGFIIEIDDEYVYICTNQHVVATFADWDICFYNKETVVGTVVGGDIEHDVAVVRVDRNEISSELMDGLYTVHVDMTDWENMNGCETDVGFHTIGSDGEIVRSKTGTLIGTKIVPSWETDELYTELDMELVHGDSGSAIFDGNGNLVTMVYALSSGESATRYWGIDLDDIVSCYNEITGHTLYVH